MASVATLALAGDVMLGRMANQVLLQKGPSYPWGNVLPFLQSPELTIVNLECVIATGGQPWTRWHKVFHFRADPMALEALKIAGVDGVVLANNHVLDYEEEALLEMLDLLEKNGMPYAGAGRNREEASRPLVLDAGGLRVGVVAFTDNEPGWAATPSHPGTNWIPISLEEKSLGPVRESIERARQAGADLVVFSNHWGPNMVARPSQLFRQFARAIMEAGADIYYGHSAHVFQGIEIYQGRPILYDTGDFVDDYAVDPELRNDRSLLFYLRLTPKGVERIELLPVKIDYCQVNLARDGDWEAIAQRMTVLSAEMGTEVRREGEQLWVACHP